MKAKIWKIKGFEGSFSDEELITLIKQGRIDKNYYIKTNDFKDWLKIKDSIYQFYLKEKKDENI